MNRFPFQRKESATPRLAAREERALLLRAQAGDAGAREQLLEALQPFVLSLAGRFVRRGAELDDLVQAGMIGQVAWRASA